MKGCMDKLKKAQQSELNTAFEEITPGLAVPTFGNSSSASTDDNSDSTDSAPTKASDKSTTIASSSSSAPAAATPATVAAVVAPIIDARKFTKEVDLLMQLPKERTGEDKFTFTKCVEHKKWLHRKQGLQMVLSIIGPVPKLQGSGGAYGELVGVVRKLLLKDSNQAVVIEAVKVVGALADGLRKEFHMYGKGLTLELLQKLKDKKVAMVAAVHHTLDQLYLEAVSLDQIMGDLQEMVGLYMSHTS